MNQFIKTIKDTGITAHLRKDGIVQLFIKDHTHVTHDELNKLIKKLNGFKQDKIPLIVEAGEFVTIGKDAKEFAQEFEQKAKISSRAVITKNLAQKILVNYYYKSQQLKKPFQEFESIEEAERWLKSQMN